MNIFHAIYICRFITAGRNGPPCHFSLCGNYIWQLWQPFAGRNETNYSCVNPTLLFYDLWNWCLCSKSLTLAAQPPKSCYSLFWPRVLFFQIDKEEVSLRRVIGAKKDQYFLDKKMVTYVSTSVTGHAINGNRVPVDLCNNMFDGICVFIAGKMMSWISWRALAFHAVTPTTLLNRARWEQEGQYFNIKEWMVLCISTYGVRLGGNGSQIWMRRGFDFSQSGKWSQGISAKCVLCSTCHRSTKWPQHLTPNVWNYWGRWREPGFMMNGRKRVFLSWKKQVECC